MIPLSLRAKLLGGAAALLILIGVAYCHHRDTGLVQQGVSQERTRVADSVITVTDTVFVRETTWVTKAVRRVDSQRVVTRDEFAKALNEKPAEVPLSRDDSTGQTASHDSAGAAQSWIITPPNRDANVSAGSDTTIQHVVRVCNTQIADDSTALAAALSALHTCEANGAAWKAKAQIVQPKPSRVTPFVLGAASVALLVTIIHFVK